jgi:acetone carboxylase gamma subunit
MEIVDWGLNRLGLADFVSSTGFKLKASGEHRPAENHISEIMPDSTVPDAAARERRIQERRERLAAKAQASHVSSLF